MKKSIKIIFILAIAMTVFSFSLTLFAQTAQVNVYEKLQPFFESLYYIEREYFEKDDIDIDKLTEASIRGLISGLGDRFTYYLTAEETQESNLEQEGQYGGLGLHVTYDAQFKVLRVVSPMVGTPAFKAGLKANDLIITIDSMPVDEMTYMESVNNLRGDPGTIVKLEVFREGIGSLEFMVERKQIKLAMVQSDIIEFQGRKIGYIRINNFFENANSELRNALNRSFDNKVEGIILDLRNNPGGYLTQAILTASMFIDGGEKVVTTRSSDGYENVYKSIGNDFPDIPMVTLVNQGSASSSEILSGAIKDYGISPLVGERTFGKAAVQTLFPLSNGGEIWLTTAHYFTPNGADIHMKGIEPDILVEYISPEGEFEDTDETALFEIKVYPERDNQLLTALDLLIEGLE